MARGKRRSNREKSGKPPDYTNDTPELYEDSENENEAEGLDAMLSNGDLVDRVVYQYMPKGACGGEHITTDGQVICFNARDDASTEIIALDPINDEKYYTKVCSSCRKGLGQRQSVTNMDRVYRCDDTIYALGVGALGFCEVLREMSAADAKLLKAYTVEDQYQSHIFQADIGRGFGYSKSNRQKVSPKLGYPGAEVLF